MRTGIKNHDSGDGWAAPETVAPHYLRLSVTDRCNLRCTYCMPRDGVIPVDRQEVLSLEETVNAVLAIDRFFPLRKIRITGGEPLVRGGLVDLVSMLAECLPQCELCMTTNATRLADHATALARAGLERVNISIDTLQPARYRALTRGGSVEDAIRGLRAARAAGLGPVRLNSVLMRGVNQFEVIELVRFALAEGAEIRFLELMGIGPAQGQYPFRFLPAGAALETLEAEFDLRPLERTGTATWYDLEDGTARTRLGIIAPVTEPFCDSCNRLRLDARGRLYPCLMSDRFLLLPRRYEGELAEWIVDHAARQLPQLKKGHHLPTRRKFMSDIGG